MAQIRHQRKFGAGFTLIEILIVVSILAGLAAIVLPLFADAIGGAEQTAFIADMRVFIDAATIYTEDTGLYLEDSSSGDLPTGWDPYVKASAWTSTTPIGGVWDFELDSHGIKSAFGVHFDGTGATRNNTYMQQIDVIFDDGDLTTGGFRQIAADRYYFILEDI